MTKGFKVGLKVVFNTLRVTIRVTLTGDGLEVVVKDPEVVNLSDGFVILTVALVLRLLVAFVVTFGVTVVVVFLRTFITLLGVVDSTVVECLVFSTFWVGFSEMGFL